MSTQAGGLFMDYRLGELEEISTRLRDLSSVKAVEAKEKRDIIQKVVGYMTLGLDMSSIFMDILMQATTRDVIQKKLVYLYLVHYATVDPQKTMMAISCLQKDCFDDDPVIRGLSLRSLCSVRVKDLTEYVVDPLKKGLCDTTPYVRKTAVMGCLKLYITSPETAKSFRVTEQLMTMVRDRDAQVVANALYVLNEIYITTGGLTLEHKVIVHLLNRMRDFNDWAQCMVLDVCSRHAVKDQKELMDIMNLLDPKLKTTNCGVILAITKVFLHLTKDVPDGMKRQVFSRLQVPLITHMCSQGPELCYVLLQHIQLLVVSRPAVFMAEYKRFYIRVNDPAYTKMIKLDILSMLVRSDSLDAITAEVVFSTGDMDLVVAKHAVRKLGEITAKLEDAERAPVFAQLLGMLEGNRTHVLNTAIVAIAEMLRKSPTVVGDVITELQKLICTNHDKLEDAEAKCAALWILGEYGSAWSDSPYVLEDICAEFAEEESSMVRLQMLNTTARMFFNRPAECKKLLAHLLKTSIEEDEEDDEEENKAGGNSQDVRDRALLYYRLFHGKIQTAFQVICAARAPISVFAEEDAPELRKQIMDEFNTLSVVYGAPADTFLLPYPEPGFSLEESEEEEEEVPEEAAAAGGEGGDLLGGFGGAAAPAAAPAPLTLNPAPVAINQQVFAATWQSCTGQSCALQAAGGADFVIAKLAPLGISVFAKGNTPDGGAKVYMFAEFADASHGFAELMINPTGGINAVVKCDGNDAAKTKHLFERIATVRTA